MQNEFDSVQAGEQSAETDTLKQPSQPTSPQVETSPAINPIMSSSVTGRSTYKTERRSANTLYQELSFQDNEDGEDNEVTGLFLHAFKRKQLKL